MVDAFGVLTGMAFAKQRKSIEREDIMNLLNNKELLRGLLKHSDLANTINGGVSQTTVQVTNNENQMVIKVSAPTVQAEAFNIVLNLNKLTLFSELVPEVENENDAKAVMKVPMFIRTFNLPASVNTDLMEAYFEDGALRIILPRRPKNTLHRQVPIKAL